MDKIPWATLIALETYRATGDATFAMKMFRDYGGTRA